MEERPTPEQIWKEYDRGVSFKLGLNLYDTVKNNENFFIGKQWEGVQANGLPTPVFNFIKRIILYLVASTATDNLKINASPMGREEEGVCRIVNREFERLFEADRMGKLTREMMRNAAVDGDGCLYTWFDPEFDTGSGRGGIRTEVLENTRVFFGNTAEREVERQPYFILVRRELPEEVRRRARRFGGEEDILPDEGEAGGGYPPVQREEGRCTVLTRLWRDRETGTIRACECTKTAMVRPPWDTRQRRYPIVWLPWDYVQDCYHGTAAVTGLIPNQIFVNKLFAMTMISLMTTAYPKIIYDRTRIARWDNRVGAAIAVNGGDMGSVARTIDPASISPQVSQFIQLAIQITKEFSGATDAALGNVKPENTSAIIALQKASGVPLELVKQNFYQCIEDLGRIWLDLMRVYYGRREVQPGEGEERESFDFSRLDRGGISLKLDVGGSAYWSEIAQMNTLDNLLATGKIGIVDYLERVPNGYISDQQRLIEKLREEERTGGESFRKAGGSGPVLLQDRAAGGERITV